MSGNTSQPTAAPYVSSRKSALLTGIRTETLRLCAADTVPSGLRYRTCERCKDVKDSAMKQLAKKGGQASPVKPAPAEIIVPTLDNVVVSNGEVKTTETETESAMVEVPSSVLKVEGDVTSTVASDLSIEPLHATDTNTDISISVKQEDTGVVTMDVETSHPIETIEIKTENTTNLDPSTGPSSTSIPSSGPSSVPSSDPMSIVTLSCVRCPCVYHWDCAKALGPTDGAAVGDANQFFCCKCR